jgi:arsenate reductase
MNRVLILCTGNSCRSQMAEGLFRQLAGSAYEVHSAGTRPTTINPLAIKSMAAIGIDISKQRSKSVDEFVDHPFDLAITVCDNAKGSCPILFWSRSAFTLALRRSSGRDRIGSRETTGFQSRTR